MDYNEKRARAVFERFGFNFNSDYRNEIRQLLQDEVSNYKEDESSEYLRVLCGFLFCIGDLADLELIKKVKYGINMDVGYMIDGEWINSMANIPDEFTRTREEIVKDYVKYYKHYFSL